MTRVDQPRRLAWISSIPSQPIRSSNGVTAWKHAHLYARTWASTAVPVTNCWRQRPRRHSNREPLAIPNAGSCSKAVNRRSKWSLAMDTSASTLITTSGTGSQSADAPISTARAIRPPRRKSAACAPSSTCTHGCDAASLRATSSVPSSEPVSTMIHSAGDRVCRRRDEASRTKLSASFRATVTTPYERAEPVGRAD